MSSYVASTSNNKPTQHIVTGKVQQMESRKRPHPLEDERLCGASSVTNKSEQRKIYVDIPAKRICRVNVSTKALDKQSLSGPKPATGCGSAASVGLPLISVQVYPSSLVRKECSAFVSADAVPVVFVPLQLMMQQMQPQQQQQQQKNKVLPTSLPQQHSNQPVTCPATASQLQQEIDVLKQKRKDLLQRLSLFHQLFRNKERLASVARRLGIKIE
ncbi:uncharacterized protein [Palaemon carinicauda]|uniref:uncharacterized protein n=1 Tax=Palaemon carinicauda TaxID=392227 RepID=UPI0035B6A28D